VSHVLLLQTFLASHEEQLEEEHLAKEGWHPINKEVQKLDSDSQHCRNLTENTAGSNVQSVSQHFCEKTVNVTVTTVFPGFNDGKHKNRPDPTYSRSLFVKVKSFPQLAVDNKTETS
jgi:hypothetical protein